ncbi:hypothetical protein H4Q26_000871 [Puccinia striiformis f. sp. tritici PST-130]|nr:hypothetical protein H4Q26_000871 [Puccinia striiformis f. sp. tritici PST-130]
MHPLPVLNSILSTGIDRCHSSELTPISPNDQSEEDPKTADSTEKGKASSGRRGSRRKRQAATVARFNPSGDLIYVGTSQGTLHLFDCELKSS